MQTIAEIEALLISLIKLIATHPEDVETFVDEHADEKGDLATIHIKVHNDDIGLCIGEQGVNAEAVRKVIGLISTRQLGRRVYIKIDTPRIPKNHFDFASQE